MPPERNLLLRRSAWVMLGYVSALALAELLALWVNSVASVIAHALLVLVLLTHYARQREAVYRRVLPVLLLAPLLRLLSLSLPVAVVPRVYWAALSGVPLWIGVVLTARTVQLSAGASGLQRTRLWPEVWLALSGLPLSLIAYLLLPSQLRLTPGHWWEYGVAALVLVVFSGCLEELIFRGLLQRTLTEVFGPAGLLVSGLTFAVMYAGTHSPAFVLFALLLGAFYGWGVNRTGALWGVMISHSLVSLGAWLLWPLVWP